MGQAARGKDEGGRMKDKGRISRTRPLDRFDCAVIAIREATANAISAFSAADDCLQILHKLSENLSTIQEALPRDVKVATLRLAKLDRKIQIIRSAELASFSLEVKAVVEEAYRDLP